MYRFEIERTCRFGQTKNSHSPIRSSKGGIRCGFYHNSHGRGTVLISISIEAEEIHLTIGVISDE
jgi:hypothetical protein